MKTRKMVNDESTVRTKPVIAWGIAVFWILLAVGCGMVWLLAILKVVDIVRGLWA